MGLGLAVVGVVTVLDATVAMKPPESTGLILGGGLSWPAPVATWLSLGLGSAFAVVALVVLGSMVRLGRLGSPWFRRIYNGDPWSRFLQRVAHSRFGAWFPGRADARPWEEVRTRTGLWSFLKDTSTGVLAVREAGPAGPEGDKGRRTAARRDDDLAARLAGLWDEAARAGLRQRWPAPGRQEFRSELIRRDIWLLARRIEQWSISTLLLTERPRRMHRHRLPKLTMLYRACSFLPGSFLNDETTMVVSRTDLVLTLRASGLRWDQAGEIDDELCRQARRTGRESEAPATELLWILRLWDIEPGMSVAQVAAVLRRVRAG